jgi:hypothetical protein
MSYQQRQVSMGGYSFMQVGSLEASAINACAELSAYKTFDTGNKSKEGALALAKAALVM